MYLGYTISGEYPLSLDVSDVRMHESGSATTIVCPEEVEGDPASGKITPPPSCIESNVIILLYFFSLPNFRIWLLNVYRGDRLFEFVEPIVIPVERIPPCEPCWKYDTARADTSRRRQTTNGGVASVCQSQYAKNKKNSGHNIRKKKMSLYKR